MDKRALGEKIRTLRETAKKKQIDVEQDSGVAYRAIQRVESGLGNPKVDTLDAIVKALDHELEFKIIPKVKGATSKKTQASPDLAFAAELLSKIHGLRPARRQYVLALIFDDGSFLEAQELRQAFQAISKSL